MTTGPERDDIPALNEIAATYYRDQLLDHRNSGPRDYLTARGFGALLNDTRWTVGYAPAGWTYLHDHLARLGHSDDAMLTAGLISISRRGTPIDRFRDRITFGIRSADTNLVGFTARAAPQAPEGTPKYLNTPQTSAYNKGTVMFGLGEASTVLRAEATIITEGPLDALAVDFVGEGRWTPVALCGTAFTHDHAAAIAALARPPVMAFDDDGPGHRALVAAAAALMPTLSEPLAASIHARLDPAALLALEGGGALKACLESPSRASDVVLSHILCGFTAAEADADGARQYLATAARALAQLGVCDPARHAVRMSQALHLDMKVVTGALADAIAPDHRRESGYGPLSANRARLVGPCIGLGSCIWPE